MRKIVDICDNILRIICVIIFAFIVIVGVYQIVTRYVFNSPSTMSEELLTYSFTWLALLSAALVFGKREHMAMTFIFDKIEPSKQRLISIINELLVLIFAVVVFIYGGISITKLTSTQQTASLGIPMSYIYVVVPISGVIIAFYAIANILQEIKKGGNV